MPQGIKVLEDYKKVIKGKPEYYLEDYMQLKKQIEEAPIKHNGLPIGFLYNPLFYSSKEISKLAGACQTLSQIMNKLIKEYLKNYKVREIFNFPPELESLILLDPGYNSFFPMARFDVFYNFYTESFKFCELNADGSSGMTKSLLLDKEFCKTEPIEKIGLNKITYYDPVSTWVDLLVKTYKEFAGNGFKPNMAIMDLDWSKQGMVTEFFEFKNRLERLGLQVIICDPRELKLRDNKLYKDDFPVDLIYRRAVTSDLLDIYEEIPDLVQALQKQAVCMVGSFRSQIIHNKKIFAILYQEGVKEILTAEEQNFIKEHIPYTAIINSHNKEEFLDNHSKWVLKPLDSYQSQGVFIGKDKTMEQWKDILEEIEPGQYLVQEFVEVPKITLLDYRDEKLFEQEYNQMIGLFMYDNDFTGFYTRVSPLNNVASGLGAVAVANLIVDDVSG